MSVRHICFSLGAAPPSRLDKALARDVPEEASLSRTRLARLIVEGRVFVNDAPVVDPKSKIAEGDVVRIALEEATVSHIQAQQIPLNVIYEDSDLIVVDKPPGMVVHPAPGTPDGTLVNALMAHCGDRLSGVGGVKRPGIVHRIDKDTSGLLVAAKTDVAHRGLAAQFEAHRVERIYTCLVYGVPDANDPRLRGVRGASFEPGNILKLTTRLARHRTDRQKQAIFFESGRHAVTRARTVARYGTPPVLARMECWLETGRTHQIRVHMAHAGHGLVGDPTYGGRRKLARGALSANGEAAVQAFGRQALHAAVLGFEHPVSKARLRFEAEMPTDMKVLFNALQPDLS